MAIFSAIASAVGAVASFIGGLGAIGSFVLKTAVGIGLNLLAQSIAGKPKDPTFSINGSLQAGGDLPRSFILGRTATAGSLVWANTWGNVDDTPNAFLTQVIALADLPIASLDEVWVNGERCTLGADTGYGRNVNEYHDSLWVKFYDGTQTTADPFLVSTASNGQRQWESTRVGLGVAYAIVTAKVTKNLFSGIPSFKFVVSGTRLYDPSRDSSVGGSGSHRWSTPNTWGGDGDHLPAVQAYNLLRGLTFGNKWFYGLQGLAAARLPAANWIAQINKCRATIGGASGPEPTYRSAGEIQIEAPLASALEAILTSCQGRISEIGGVYSIYLGAPDLPTFSFTDGDILSTEEQSFTPFFGLADTINGISATYPSPADGWAAKTAPPLYRSDLEALHGNRRLMADVPLDFVPYAEQVQRLMLSALQEGQRARRHTLVLPPEFWPYAVPGGVLSWTSERNGYIAKLFRIDGVADRASLDVMIDITEVDPSDYDWDSGDFQEPVDGAVGPIRPQPQPIIDWFAEPSTIKDDAGLDRRPAILLTWDNTAGRLVDVVGIEFQVRLAADLSTVYGGRTDQPETGSLKISQGLLPDTFYGVRGRYLPGGDRPTLWSDWLPVRTPNIRIADVEVGLAALRDDVYKRLLQLAQESDEFRARLEQLALAASDAAGVIVDENSVSVRFRSATAGALTGISASIEEIDGAIEALATAYTAVSASVGNLAADGLWRMQAQAGSGGNVQASVVLQVRATTGSGWITAGTLWEVGSVGGVPFSRIVLFADQLVLTNGTGTALPFVYDAGGLRLAVANIGTVTAGTIRSPDGKFVITLSTGSIEWFD